MCGRYSFVPTKKQQHEDLDGVEFASDMPLRYNIAPTQLAYVITADAPQVLQPMHWGLVPYWSRDGVNNGKLINARAEGILEKPSFRSPALRRHCLVPADSFYEWRTLPGKRKVPYRILRKDGRLMFMAGIWDEWQGDGMLKKTFSIITTAPNAEVAALHDRMPVLFLTADEQQGWLQAGDPEEIRSLLHPPPNDVLAYYRVSDKLNSASYEEPGIHDPVEEDGSLF